ncbi:glycosyltransferase family 2 protein [Vibrio sp. MED222]|uniref:glycosyltransferase family 2 protein n=1 Tax=Vibrio sp. MED222 TaxID=314290 RepID=UPI000068B0AF|nr:glycosyltransferase family 2 protein [Vibrio sp. MED222]EAQ53738.1 glycosyl transferase, group 2 family protein [Vibrio sp. MED222]
MKVAVVIPCFKVKNQICKVLDSIGNEVDKIYVIDDCCPAASGKFVLENNKDTRVKVIFSEVNSGVGGAVMKGYIEALKDGMDIIIKIDGDGQMDPTLIPKFINPIIQGHADYTKGNRFNRIESLILMPTIRKLGNAILSFVNKVSSGYWKVMDPTNGYTAIHRSALLELPLNKISQRYFFESDMLFRLGTIRAVVQDISMDAKYDDEESSLEVKKVIFEFTPLYIKSFFKRIFYAYFLRDFNVASIELILGSIMMLFGFCFGVISWFNSISTGDVTSTGTVMIAVMPIIMGFQLLLSSLHYDITNSPLHPLQKK